MSCMAHRKCCRAIGFHSKSHSGPLAKKSPIFCEPHVASRLRPWPWAFQPAMQTAQPQNRFSGPKTGARLPPPVDLNSPWGDRSRWPAMVTGTIGVTNFSIAGPGLSFEHLLTQAHARAMHGHAYSHCSCHGRPPKVPWPCLMIYLYGTRG